MNAVDIIEPVSEALRPRRDLSASLDPHEHAAIIHPEDGRTAAIFRGPRLCKRTQTWSDFQGAEHGGMIEEAVAKYRPHFITMNTFRTRTFILKDRDDWRDKPWKETRNLASLQAVWLELDYHKKPAWKRLTPLEMTWRVLDRLRDKGWPAPSYILCSGSGLHVVWLHTRLAPLKTLGLWTCLQQHLNDAFVDMGRDKAAMPPTTNLRLAGTRNNGKPVGILWPVHVDEIVRHDFDDLRSAILPWSIEEARAYKAKMKAQKAARTARLDAPTGTPRLTGTTFYATLLSDLQKVMDDFHPGVVGEGYRNDMLFIHARVWAWILEPDELVAKIEAESFRFGYTPREAVKQMVSVIRRARRVYTCARGSGDPRYKIGPQRIRVDLGITARTAKRLDLRMLIPPSLRRVRAAERAEKSRRARGAESRTEQQALRLEHGREAIRLREVDGLTRTQIAERLGGVSTGYVDKAIREAKAVASIVKTPVRKRKVEIDEDALEAEIVEQNLQRRLAMRELDAISAGTSHGSSRYMSDEGEVLVADTADAYHADVHGVAPPSSEEQQQRLVGTPSGPLRVSDDSAPRNRIPAYLRR